RFARIKIVNEDGNRLWRVARGFQSLQSHPSEVDSRSIAERSKCITSLGFRSEVNRRTCPIAQFQMPSNKISVQMGQYDVLNFEFVLCGKCNVLVGVALRVNDSCRACTFVANQIRRMCQTRQVELFENHATPLSMRP